MKEENLRGKEKKKIEFFKAFKKKEVWISGIVGILIGALLIYLLGILGVPGFGNETVATMKSGKITENKLYGEMKKNYPISYVLEVVDKLILDDKYKLDEKQTSEIEKSINEIIDSYKTSYGITEEDFLTGNGFETRDEFKDYLSFSYKTNLSYIDYLKTMISEEEINNYYNENVYGEINTKHILAKTSDTVKDEETLKLAKEIIAKLDSGKSFDEVVAEYGDKITYEELGYNGFTSGLVSEYVEASKTLENGAYSKEPVKTSFGYHIIYKIDQKEKPSLEDVENDIILMLGQPFEQEDPNIRDKALIKLREENNLKFRDSKIKSEYEDYCKEINGETEEQ